MALRRAHGAGRAGQAVLAHALLGIDDLLDRAQEPRIDLAGGVDLLVVEAEAHGLRDLSRRSGVGMPSAARMTFLSSPAPRPSMAMSSRPVRPVSRPRSAFCRLSSKVRPMAMTSPTDFIEVVSVGSAPGNFSKAKRGILVTT